MSSFLPRVAAGLQQGQPPLQWSRAGWVVGCSLTSTGYGPSKAVARRPGASLGSPGSPGATVVVVVAAATVGVGEECGGGLGGRGPPVSRSSSRAMVGEAAVSSDTAWSCLASVMSTPLIYEGTLMSERVGRTDKALCRLRHPTHRENTVANLQRACSMGSTALGNAGDEDALHRSWEPPP